MMPKIRLQYSQPQRRRRISRWTAVLFAMVLVIGTGVMTPPAALAGSADNDSNVDARLIGYPNGHKVAIEKSSSTPAFLLFFVLVVVGCIPLFKNAKRD
jgi:hypothetical protein